jgi:hypothetical protein
VTSTLVLLSGLPRRSDTALDRAPAPSQAGMEREFISPARLFVAEFPVASNLNKPVLHLKSAVAELQYRLANRT